MARCNSKTMARYLDDELQGVQGDERHLGGQVALHLRLHLLLRGLGAAQQHISCGSQQSQQHRFTLSLTADSFVFLAAVSVTPLLWINQFTLSLTANSFVFLAAVSVTDFL